MELNKQQIPEPPLLHHITLDEVKELSANIKELTKWVRNFNSLWRAFFRGMLIGLGTAVGATIIATILFAVLARFTNSFDNVPIIKEFININGLKSSKNFSNDGRYYEGYYIDPITKNCVFEGREHMSDPFEFHTLDLLHNSYFALELRYEYI